jgi:hypothetical protein
MLPTIRILPAAVVSVIAVVIIASVIAAAGAAAVISTAVATVRELSRGCFEAARAATRASFSKSG